MAAAKTNNSQGKKRPGTKKSKSRTVVAVSSSESDSDVSEPRTKDVKVVNEEIASTASPEPTKKSKKTKSKTTPAISKEPLPTEDDDVHMTDGDLSPVPVKNSAQASPNPASNVSEDFASIYLRKVTKELADDLDKIREAKDFNANSIPMLIHALKQGGSMYSAEEKRRVVTSAES